MIKFYFSLVLIVGMSLVMTSCEKEDPEIPNEEELITTFNYYLTPANGDTTIVFSFKDLDGDGGNEAEIIGGVLDANMVYSGRVELLNEAESPVENITTEVEEEGTLHQFFFQTSIADLSIKYTDVDNEGNPIGVASELSTGTTTSGTLTITLRHEPNKSASGVANGEIGNAGGETDIQVTFPIDVQ